MSEINITIDGVNLADFFGTNNAKFKLLRAAFPKLKLIPRGNNIKVIGSPADISGFQNKVESITHFMKTHGSINKQHIEELLEGERPVAIPKGSKDVILYGPFGNLIKAKTPNQKRLVTSSEQNDIVFAIGPAGTGKTYTAVAMAVRALKNKIVKKIVLTRPAVEAGESLGFLPGDLKDKIDPYLRPLYDALDDMIPAKKLNEYMDNRIIEIAPLAYMRGRTIDNSFIILDEAQNATTKQLKMFLTRIGPSARCIITGDLTQVDLPHNQRSGLRYATQILKNIKGIGIIYLSEDDVIRHRLVKQIIKAYDRAEQREVLKESAHNNEQEN